MLFPSHVTCVLGRCFRSLLLVRVGEDPPSVDASEWTGGKLSVRSFFDSTTFIVHEEDIHCAV